MKACNVGQQLMVLQNPRRRRNFSLFPIVIAAGRDLQGLAHGRDGMLGFHCVDPLVTLLGGSEMIPKVFFKMSRCWRSSSFSLRKAAFSACRSACGPAGITLLAFHAYNCFS